MVRAKCAPSALCFIIINSPLLRQKKMTTVSTSFSLKDRLAKINSRVTDFHEDFKRQVDETKQVDLERFELIQNGIEHLDKILQLETERATKRLDDIRKKFTTRIMDTRDALGASVSLHTKENNDNFSDLAHKCRHAMAKIAQEHDDLLESIRYFKTSAEESFGAFIGNLTNERNTRMALATEIYSKVDRDLKHATDMNDRARADREQSIDEYLRDSEILSRHYESIARDGVVSLSAECKVLAGVVAELIATRKTSYDEIVRTMGSVLDGLQNNMKKISTFIRPEDDQEEKFVF
ncbi:SF-assemblin/beta giardin family protein [Giardia duodenalis]|nr:SF-assemblin/beta giardin family protein [Giardia intestinalis]|eukprot:XP_001707449.1 Delta giardin [Giardia lamblia ATCC 50803]